MNSYWSVQDTVALRDIESFSLTHFDVNVTWAMEVLEYFTAVEQC